MENKKIKNATPREYDGIHFKSLLEVSIYKNLVAAGFHPKYEQFKCTVVDGLRPTVPFYATDKQTKDLKLHDKKIRSITYTPDFTFIYKDIFVVIEAKGQENDTYPLKKKLFRKWMEKWLPNGIFFEIRTIKQLKQAIKIIEDYEKSYVQNKKSAHSSTNEKPFYW